MGEVVSAGEFLGADEEFVCWGGGDGNFVAGLEVGGGGEASGVCFDECPVAFAEFEGGGGGFLAFGVVGDAEDIAGVGVGVFC